MRGQLLAWYGRPRSKGVEPHARRRRRRHHHPAAHPGTGSGDRPTAAGPQHHQCPTRLRRRGLSGPARVRGRRPGRPRSVHPPRPDGRGGIRARRTEGHALASPPRVRDRHLHDRRRLRARRFERRRRGHHQRRHPMDDRRCRDPPYREAAGVAGRERRPVPRPAAVGQPAGRPEADRTALPGPACERGGPGLLAATVAR